MYICICKCIYTYFVILCPIISTFAGFPTALRLRLQVARHVLDANTCDGLRLHRKHCGFTQGWTPKGPKGLKTIGKPWENGENHRKTIGKP